MNATYGFIYVVSNLITGKSYVGQTRRNVAYRWSVHKSEAKRRPRSHFHKSISKHGPAAFEVQCVASAEDLKTLNALETAWILALGTHRSGCGYNLTTGGDSRIRSAETCAKLSAANRGKTASNETKAKMSLARRGRKHSIEHNRAKSLGLKGRRPSPQCLAAVTAANRLRQPSLETRAKLRLAALKANAVRWHQQPHSA